VATEQWKWPPLDRHRIEGQTDGDPPTAYDRIYMELGIRTTAGKRAPTQLLPPEEDFCHCPHLQPTHACTRPRALLAHSHSHTRTATRTTLSGCWQGRSLCGNVTDFTPSSNPRRLERWILSPCPMSSTLGRFAAQRERRISLGRRRCVAHGWPRGACIASHVHIVCL